MDKNDCVYKGESYPDGRELCLADQCLRCNDGKWEESEFEVGYRY